MRKFFVPLIIGLLLILFVTFLLGQRENEKLNDIYDVIVIGGEPEGVAAAVSAARNGAKTLLVEWRDELGGLFTFGMLNFLDIPQGPDGQSVSKGIFQEWHQQVGGKSSFGIQEAKDAFYEMVENEENLTLLTGTKLTEVVKDGTQVVGVKLLNETGEMEIRGKAFIDGTQDADLAVMAGAPYFVGGEDIGQEDKKMSVTLIIHLKNLDWDQVRETAESEKFGWGYVTDVAAWGFPDLLKAYKPVVDNTRLRGLNLAKVGDEYFINALQIFGVDGLSEESRQEGIERGKQETENIVAFLREEFPGFENAVVASYPTELYVRETRHIYGEYQLPMSDVWTNADHWDSIAIAAYPVDIQAQTPLDYGHVVADPGQYAIPFRSLVPLEVDGLLVVGRSAGYSSIAAGSARIVPTGMATGEAAGVAAALAVEEDVLFREMSKDEGLIGKVRDQLAAQGAYVGHFELDYPYMGEWFDEPVQRLLNYGLIFGGYDNDLKVEEDATLYGFMAIVKGIAERVEFGEETGAIRERMAAVYERILSTPNGPVTREDVSNGLEEIFLGTEEGVDGVESWQRLVEVGLVHEDLVLHIPENRPLKNKEIFAICAGLIESE